MVMHPLPIPAKGVLVGGQPLLWNAWRSSGPTVEHSWLLTFHLTLYRTFASHHSTQSASMESIGRIVSLIPLLLLCSTLTSKLEPY